MALTVDEVLEKVGSLGPYQFRLIGVILYIEGFNMVFQIMTSTFVAAEPPWHCVANATNCTLEGNFRPGLKNYSFRCTIPREQWAFDKDFTSIVTEVKSGGGGYSHIVWVLLGSRKSFPLLD